MAADGSAGSEMEGRKWNGASQPATSKRTVPKPFFVIFNEAFGANDDPTSKGLGTGGPRCWLNFFLAQRPYKAFGLL